MLQFSPPLQIQIIPQSHSVLESAQRAISPVVVVDPLTVSPHEALGRADNVAVAPTGSIRVRTDELRRSASSPQVFIIPYFIVIYLCFFFKRFCCFSSDIEQIKNLLSIIHYQKVINLNKT